MSILNRFRKKGGFNQLLLLLESCDPTKQKNLLSLVAKEDPGWAYLFKLKTITFEKLIGFDDQLWLDLIPHLNHKVIGDFIAHLEPKQKSRFLILLDYSSQRIVSQMLIEKTPTVAQQGTAFIKIVQTVRELEDKKIINFVHYDPSLVIDLKIAA